MLDRRLPLRGGVTRPDRWTLRGDGMHETQLVLRNGVVALDLSRLRMLFEQALAYLEGGLKVRDGLVEVAEVTQDVADFLVRNGEAPFDIEVALDIPSECRAFCKRSFDVLQGLLHPSLIAQTISHSLQCVCEAPTMPNTAWVQLNETFPNTECLEKDLERRLSLLECLLRSDTLENETEML